MQNIQWGPTVQSQEQALALFCLLKLQHHQLLSTEYDLKQNCFGPFSLSLSLSLGGLVKWVIRGMSEVPKCISGGSRHGVVPNCLFLLFPAFEHNGLFFNFSI